ncbi:DUF4258 domain-containing protein [Photobacterium sanctipauli]|uniref:DUF4258 domain-containing protein n=1 Tax=Photobacterium sanctipauli TaxID=1342794 RepID=A0A2T3NVA1_9GAMM|nr:DUF4258 domain-containing protein [Photobacterium sanctipauli]
MSSNQSSNSKATSRKEPAPVSQFPLQAGTALKIVNDLATNFKSRVRFSGHCRDRMKERGIRERDIFNVLKSKRSQIDEGPAQQPSGD